MVGDIYKALGYLQGWFIPSQTFFTCRSAAAGNLLDFRFECFSILCVVCSMLILSVLLFSSCMILIHELGSMCYFTDYPGSCLIWQFPALVLKKNQAKGLLNK